MRPPGVRGARGGGTLRRLSGADLYPDARHAVDALAGLGYHVGLVANQPASRTAELRALGFDTEVMAMSDEMGVAKPAPAFFARVLEMAGNADPAQVA